MTPREHDVMRSVEDQYWWYVALRRHVVETIGTVGEAASFPSETRVFARGREADNFLYRGRNPGFLATEDERSILDAGCGSGGMLQALRSAFSRVKLVGVDASQHALRLTAERLTGAELVRGSVDQLRFADGSFDDVLSIDVLTAAGVDAPRALAEAHRVLRPNGRVLVNVAAFDFLRGAHDVAVDVDHRYTSADLRALLIDAGFAIERLSYWNTLLFPAVAAIRWLSRRRARPEIARSDFRALPSLLNVTLHDIALLELRAGTRVSLPFGTSIFAVGRKHV